MKLKMLVSVAGSDFALSAGEETDRFSEKEAKRMVAAGHAERAPVVEPKKPATKAEWDDERRKILDENAALKRQIEESKAREVTLVEELAGLAALKSNIAAALGVSGAPIETATLKPVAETRG